MGKSLEPLYIIIIKKGDVIRDQWGTAIVHSVSKKPLEKIKVFNQAIKDQSREYKRIQKQFDREADKRGIISRLDNDSPKHKN